VSDTGEGIPEDQLETVFEAFAQANGSGPAYARQFEGAGLGLPLVKRLVGLMGGNACVVSREGEGTTVYLSLPFRLAGSHAQSAAHGQREEQAGLSPARKVLVADDDAATRMHMHRLLSKQGWLVSGAENGEQALQELRQQEYDLVLMDVQMPVVDGIEATRHIRASDAGFKDIPIIALTAYAMAGDREKFLEAGMDDYIAKPVDMQELMEVLQRSLDPSSRSTS
jgi:CheY-like chemotaxis protein